MSQKRHTCTFCSAKRNEENMILYESKFLRKKGWICKFHTSDISDISDIRPNGEKPVFVELFSGSGHISQVARDWGYDTVTVDMNPKYKPDICVDILNLRATKLPKSVSAVWASIPCYVFTILAIAHNWEKINIGNRQYYYVPKNKKAIEALRIVNKTIDVIKKLNPVYWFIENPRGALRHMPQMRLAPYRRTVSYADYGFKIYKPTDIFTNCKEFRPKEIRGAVGRKFELKIEDLSNSYQRSLVPPDLIHELFYSIRFLTPDTEVKNGKPVIS